MGTHICEIGQISQCGQYDLQAIITVMQITVMQICRIRMPPKYTKDCSHRVEKVRSIYSFSLEKTIHIIKTKLTCKQTISIPVDKSMIV